MPSASDIPRYQPWLALYCVVALVVTAFLLFAGGFTTSIQAGMAFLDWPLSNNSLNPPGWLENESMRAEHSHRLLGMTLGVLAIGAVVWTQLTESRRWVKRLAIILLVAIILQGALGGGRVLFDHLNTGWSSNIVSQTFAVLHAAGAEITLCLWVTLAAAESRGWVVRGVGTKSVSLAVRRWAGAAVALIFLQIIIGAVMRHGGYALAIATFPWCGQNHEIMPVAWNWPVVVNFAHRVGATLVTIALCGLGWNIFRDVSARRQLANGMAVIICAVALQIWLGGLVIWTIKNAHAATFHMLVGAFLLASTWLVALLAYRSVWWPPAATDHAAST